MNQTLNETLDFIRQYCLRYTPEKPVIQYRESLAKERVRFVVSFKEQAGNQLVVRSVTFDVPIVDYCYHQPAGEVGKASEGLRLKRIHKIIRKSMLPFLKKVKEER